MCLYTYKTVLKNISRLIIYLKHNAHIIISYMYIVLNQIMNLYLRENKI